MKKLLILCLLILPISIYCETVDEQIARLQSQINEIPDPSIVNSTTAGIAKVYNDGTKVVEKTYDVASKLAPKVEAALTTIGQSLKVSANEVWHILVRQQLVWSLGYLILTLSSIASLIHLIWRYNNNNKRAFKVDSRLSEGIKTEWQDADSGIFILSIITWIALSIMSVLNFTDMLTGFINPEFGALKTIAEIASQIK